MGGCLEDRCVSGYYMESAILVFVGKRFISYVNNAPLRGGVFPDAIAHKVDALGKREADFSFLVYTEQSVARKCHPRSEKPSDSP